MSSATSRPIITSETGFFSSLKESRSGWVILGLSLTILALVGYLAWPFLKSGGSQLTHYFCQGSSITQTLTGSPPAKPAPVKSWFAWPGVTQ